MTKSASTPTDACAGRDVRLMHVVGWLIGAVALLGCTGVKPSLSAVPPPTRAALSDPIPEKITRGDIVVGVEPFVRLPRTTDSGSHLVNDAHARIQYLIPFGNTHGTLLINDTRGVLYLTDHRGATPVKYLDLREENVGFEDAQFPNEMGIASVAFHPEFTSIGKPGFGKFYTAYSATTQASQPGLLKHDAASHESVIREWTAYNPRARAFAGTSREIFRVGQFAPNHNIGTIAFNPIAEVGSADYGVLYVALGDGGAANDPRDYGQSLESPLGAILRLQTLPQRRLGEPIQPYGIPPDNPFVMRPQAQVAAEIWVMGLRHAQHFSWDSTGRLFINDIGQNQVEEVNLGVAGANYGWRLREGGFATGFAVPGGRPGEVYALADTADEFVYPIAQYDHDEGYAIGSGFLYEGTALPELRGKYVFADIVNGRIFYFDAAELQPGRYQRIFELRLSFEGRELALSTLTSVDNTYVAGQRVDLRLGMDALGELYLLTKSDGWVRKLVALD